MKLLGIIVTYYPNIRDLTLNINKFINSVDRLIIWQNTPLADRGNYQINLDLFDGEVVLMGNDKNMGIAYALNQAYSMMLNTSNKFSYLLTMDQDSTFINFDTYYGEVKSLPKDSIYSPNINNEINLLKENLHQVKTCITSGAIFPLKVLKTIGEFNEDYSVDCVDYDFCFKATSKGIKIFKVTIAKMNQIYGEPTKSIFFNLENNIYSAQRLFFISRNHILLWRDYPSHMDYLFIRIILISHIFGKIVKVIFMEKNKINKIQSILHGFYAGLTNNRSRKY